MLDVYRLDQYVAKLKAEGDASIVGRDFNINELECSICLEKISSENSLVPEEHPSGLEPMGLVTALPCNVLHVFHPQCISLWLHKSSACPLCKYNAFTG